MMRPRRTFLILCIVASAFVVGCDDSPTVPSVAFELALSPPTVAAGATSQGTVTLPRASAYEVAIQLSSSDAVASVPASIVISAGRASVDFVVNTRLVAADTTTRITAIAGGARQDATLQVLSPVARPPTLDSLELNATVVRGGQSAQGTVRLTAAAPDPAGLRVNVRSSNAAAVVFDTVLVPAGAVTATFPISTRPVDLETHLEITAAYLDQTRTVPLRISP